MIGFVEGNVDGTLELGLTEGPGVGDPSVGNGVGYSMEGILVGHEVLGDRVGYAIDGIFVGSILEGTLVGMARRGYVDGEDDGF
jgi:hypothetical protein